MRRLLSLLLLLGLVSCRTTPSYVVLTPPSPSPVFRPGPSPSPTPTPDPQGPILFGGHTHDYTDLPLTVVKTDGTRPFTARQQGMTPVGGTDLATKAYVDSAASGAAATMQVLITATDTTEDYLSP